MRPARGEVGLGPQQGGLVVAGVDLQQHLALAEETAGDEVRGNRYDLPADLGQAVLLLAAHYYEFRHETQLGDGCMPFGVTSLIERYRTVRVFAGNAS